MGAPLFPQLESPDDRVALEVDDLALSWRQLAGACVGHAELLRGAGVPMGARVGVWTQPKLETAVALVANAALGFVSVPVDPKLGDKELTHVLGDSRPVVMVGADAKAVEGRTAAVTTLQAPPAASAPLRALERQATEPRQALVLYTSGTTGLPKGALLTADNIASNLDALQQAWAWSARDTVVHALPLFHVHGLVLGLFGALRTGGALRWLTRFSPEGVAAALSRGPTMFFAVPTMYHRLAEAAPSTPTLVASLQHARLLVSGSAPLPQRDQLALEALTGKRVVERYGLTETLINCAVKPGEPDELGRVGQPLQGVELRLVDDERRVIDAFDDATIGEVAVRGPHVFAGYLNRPDATKAVLDDDGFFFTGDLAVRRADGSIRIVGRRATDLIKCGGYKVGAGEVEAALLEHPAVREAAVLGAPDPDLGERIVAFVVVSSPVAPKALEDHVASLLSAHKRPRLVRFVDALPRNAMGKVQKSVLKQDV